MQRNALPAYGDRVAAFNALPWPRRDAAPRCRFARLIDAEFAAALREDDD